MSTPKGVVVKVGEETFLTSYGCGETIDGLLGRLNQTLGVQSEQPRLYVLASSSEENLPTITNQPDVNLNFHEDLNPSASPWLSTLFLDVDNMVLHLRPTIKSLMARKVVLEYIKKNLSKCLGARVFCIGSSMNNIFLPNETIDVTPFLCKGQEEKWFLRVNEGLCANAMANGGYDDNVQVKSITFNCENASILVNINQLSVNVCHNELVSLYSGALLEDLNHNFGRKSMIKRSLLLIKSWCCYDSCQYSAAGKSLFPDLISAKVLHILVLHLFCRFGGVINHPLIALTIFLCYYSTIDWKSVIINIDSSLSVIDLKPLTVQDIFPKNSPLLGLENSHSEELQQISSLITNYRLRYQSTIWASSRAKEEDNLEPPVETMPRDSSTERESDDRLSAPFLDPNAFRVPKGAPAWGLASACPSLTNEFQPPSGLPAENEIWEAQENRKNSHQFAASSMNVSDSIRPHVNLTSSISSADVAHITSILSSGYSRFAIVLRKCREAAPHESIDLGLGSKMDLSNYFISEAMGMSRDVANIQKLSSYSPDDAANIDELKSSKYFCESEGPESVMRHAELIMGSKITADAVAHLIAHIVEQAGPHPIGEIGKLLQEATGNPNLSRVLKSQFRGLKKLIEGYPHMLRLGGDHSFNPHVYLSEKPCCNSSDASMDALLDGMTDRESDDPALSPSGSFSLQSTKKQPNPPAANGQLNTPSLNPPEGYQYPANGQIKNQQNLTHQYQIPYRPEMIAPKTRGPVNTQAPPWQIQDNNGRLFAPSPPGFSNQNRNSIGSSRLHADAGEFEPSRSVEYYNGIRQRTDAYGPMEMAGGNRNSNQQINGSSMPQSYAPYRVQPFEQNQFLYQTGAPSRTATTLPRQSAATYPTNVRGNPASRPVTNTRYDILPDNPSYNEPPNRNSIPSANRVGYSHSTSAGYPSVGQSWDRNGGLPYDPEGSLASNQLTNNQATRISHGNIGDSRSTFGLGYDMEFARTRQPSLGHGRLQSVDNLDVGLEFESDRQSFLLPSDYDLVSQPYSISDYDILKDAAFANTIHSFGQELEDNTGTILGNRQYSDRDLLSTATGNRLDARESSFNGDSKMLAYFLRDSER